jgi:hypothetical protein
MAVPKDVEAVLSNVSSALELPSAGRKELFEYWEGTFGVYFRNWESSSTSFRSLVAEQTATLANQWAEAWLGRASAQAMESSQKFFEALKTHLAIIEAVNEKLLGVGAAPELSSYPFLTPLYPQQDIASRINNLHEIYRIVPYKVPLLGWGNHSLDEDEETRVILNQLTTAMQGASKELAASNQKIEKTLAKMESLEPHKI